jgi:UDP-N-acetylmuramoylalanine--D-glutamate ligase
VSDDRFRLEGDVLQGRRVDEDPLDLAGQSVVVVGLARSGIAAARFLARRGARVVATDRKGPEELGPEAVNLGNEGVRLELGGHREATFRGASLVVVSPGVPWSLPELELARRESVRVIAELELGYRHMRGTLAAVTGTKGKSTTTAALGAMLREAGRDVRVGGNIGEAVTGLLEDQTEATVFVLEVSSFQLEGIERFHPHVALFLNLTTDHLDRHLNFEAYARAKARIFENQDETDWALVNADDPGVLALARKGRGRLVPFQFQGEGEGAGFEGEDAVLRLNGSREVLFARSDLRVLGQHLAGDLLAAGAGARLLGTPLSAIQRAARAFRGAEHVLERVAEIGGVTFYDDSKATNIDAARKSLEAFSGGVVLIMGGRWKGGDFRELGEAVKGRVKAILAIGEARGRIREALSKAAPVTFAETLQEAVGRASTLAAPGDVVLLAPACSSFDMFVDYAERGRAYKDAVLSLGRG